MKKNSDVFSEVVVGVFMVAVLALLVYFTVVISGVDVLFGREKALARIAFTDVGGLKERDNVVYRGMKVGIVEKIELAPTNVMVTVLVDRDVVLRETCQASVSALSLLGGNYLLLEEGAGAVQPLATTVFRGDPPIDWVRDLGKIAGSLNEVLNDGSFRSIVSNFEATAENVNKIVARVERGEGTAGRLLSRDDTVYQDLREAVAGAKRAVGDAEKTFDGARKTFDHAAAVAERLDRGEGTLGRLLSKDDAVYADLKQTLANAAAISARIERGEGTLGRLTAKDDALWGDLTNAVANVRAATAKLKSGEGLLGRAFNDAALADDAAKLVTNLRTVSERLEKGEGTLGRLMTERELYDEVNAAIKDVRQIIDNYRDTTPITTFGALATGAL
ncbi:MAG: MlaD family protein [bacterium]|nr:MlaD family protein [bacterium]